MGVHKLNKTCVWRKGEKDKQTVCGKKTAVDAVKWEDRGLIVGLRADAVCLNCRNRMEPAPRRRR